ncbi:MAG: hypothetical protein PHC30_08345, partial [Lentisphaeria bacterium]|nr:hypothetical protein [Lentisphaeria bacterium]
FMKATNGWRMPRDSGADRRSPERVQEGECFVMGPWCRLAITEKNHRWTPINTDFYSSIGFLDSIGVHRWFQICLAPEVDAGDGGQ